MNSVIISKVGNLGLLKRAACFSVAVYLKYYDSRRSFR